MPIACAARVVTAGHHGTGASWTADSTSPQAAKTTPPARAATRTLERPLIAPRLLDVPQRAELGLGLVVQLARRFGVAHLREALEHLLETGLHGARLLGGLLDEIVQLGRVVLEVVELVPAVAAQDE